jgi:general secretion pathway protein G
MSRCAERSTDRARGAYTLVELSVALAIVGILAGVTGVHYISYLERARTARAIVELRNLAAQIDPGDDEDATYPATLAAAGITTRDPWGNPYQYLLIQGNLPRGLAAAVDRLPSVAAPPGETGANGGSGGAGDAGENGNTGGGDSIMASVRKDRFLAPINTDFDLYSMGPDGESRAQLNVAASRDDVIRAANGSYFGVAQEF